MSGIALRPGAYDHEFVEQRVVVMLQELLNAIGVVAENDDALTEEEHALACYLTFYMQIEQCVSEIPPASRLKGKHRTTKRLLRSMLKRMKATDIAEEHDSGTLGQPAMLAFGDLAIDFIESVHKVMHDDTRQYARDSIVKGFSGDN